MSLRLHFAASGRSALDLLTPKTSAENALRPQLMIFDVKMPGISGLDLLQTVKADPSLLSIPVYLFSGSDDQTDIKAGYRNFASGYIVKPVDADGLNEIAALIARLCVNVFVFPER
jgi:CheY-like chemotaxis protein